MLIASVFEENTTKVLQDIDFLVEQTATNCQNQLRITRGPFGAFRLATPVETLDIDAFTEFLEFNEDTTFSDLETIFGGGISAYENDLDIAELSIVPIAPTAVSALPTLDDIGHHGFDDWTENEKARYQCDYLPRYAFNHIAPPMPNPIDQQDTVLHEAPFLLKYYLESVIISQTPIISDKSPWHTLFFAHAKDAYATMTLAKAPDHASLGVFYAILAISAFSHRISSQSQRWHHLANQYRTKAKRHIERVWLDAFCFPKKLKYKAILMGLLAMVQVSVGVNSQT